MLLWFHQLSAFISWSMTLFTNVYFNALLVAGRW